MYVLGPGVDLVELGQLIAQGSQVTRGGLGHLGGGAGDDRTVRLDQLNLGATVRLVTVNGLRRRRARTSSSAAAGSSGDS